ncbi:MAG TPA: phosphoadenylyl-sulfate reductase [Chthonomonadaceae bacterium]|nr:phosphoadenylyl-sulfate reductase [Chthonomonadaceae bacterium]
MLPQTYAPTPEALKAISDSLEDKSPEEILRWAVEIYHPKLTMATAFGAEGCVLLAMLSEIKPHGKEVRVFNLETGYQFPETLALRERIREQYGIAVELVRPDETVKAMEKRFGGPIYGTNPDECCRIRKIEPLRRALAGYDAWISAIRRDQTPHRAKAGIVEWDPKFNLVKINPLANWTKRDVWAYIRINEVPYNPLHDKGYPSIGCWPCTRAVAPGEDDRAGRWSNFIKLECGLHTR